MPRRHNTVSKSPVPTAVVSDVETILPDGDETDVESIDDALRSRRIALQAQIKTERQKLPAIKRGRQRKIVTLEDVAARQESQPNPQALMSLVGSVLQRQAAASELSLSDALDSVVSLYAKLTVDIITDLQAARESDQSVNTVPFIWNWMGTKGMLNPKRGGIAGKTLAKLEEHEETTEDASDMAIALEINGR